jgi:hypothetical protein
MLQISKGANPNYLAKIVRLPKPRKHTNADRLQVFSINFMDCITDMNACEGELYVYFPVECEINGAFLSYINAYRESSLNRNRAEVGFFEKNGRVRAVKLRGERSNGYLLPIEKVEEWAGVNGLEKHEGEEFDTINNLLLVRKYAVPVKESAHTKQGKKPKISRLIDGQFHFHVDTENIRHCPDKIHPDDFISITYKYHGTSAIIANVLTKKKLNPIEWLLKKLGAPIKDTEYDVLYSSRRVVKNEEETINKPGYYNEDIWAVAKQEIGHLIPKGYTIYCEIVGFLKNGAPIQADYDYGCNPTEHKIFVYRITQTNVDGIVTELSTAQMQEFCAKTGLNYVELFYNGLARDWNPELNSNEHWNENFIVELTKKYNNKQCHVCKNNVPEEGAVIRKEKLFEFEAYKLKSADFLEYETAQLDKGESDIESNN